MLDWLNLFWNVNSLLSFDYNLLWNVFNSFSVWVDSFSQSYCLCSTIWLQIPNVMSFIWFLVPDSKVVGSWIHVFHVEDLSVVTCSTCSVFWMSGDRLWVFFVVIQVDVVELWIILLIRAFIRWPESWTKLFAINNDILLNRVVQCNPFLLLEIIIENFKIALKSISFPIIIVVVNSQIDKIISKYI